MKDKKRAALLTSAALIALVGCSSESNKSADTTRPPTTVEPKDSAATETSPEATTATTGAPTTSKPTTAAPPDTTAKSSVPAPTEAPASKGTGKRTDPLPATDAKVDEWTFTLGPLEDVPEGQRPSYPEVGPDKRMVRHHLAATYDGDDEGTAGGLMAVTAIVGSKSAKYDFELVTDDFDRTYDSIIQAPSVLGGGTIEGYCYYVVGADETDFVFLYDNFSSKTFIALG